MKTCPFRLIFIILLGFSFAGNATADGGAWRAATAREKAYFDTVSRTIAKALPAGPAGWDLVSQTEIKPLERVSVGSEKDPFPVYYTVEWLDQTAKQAGDAKVLQALTAYEQSHRDDPQVAAINKERMRLAAAVGAAAGKGDTKAMERLIKEQDVWDAKLKTIYGAWDKERDAIIAANEAHDFSLKINIRVNVFYQGYERMTPGVPVAGIPVYRIAGGHRGGLWVGEQNFVFVGKNLQMTTQNGLSVLKMPPVKGLPYLAVRLAEVAVEADPPRARQVLEGIRWDLLKGLIK